MINRPPEAYIWLWVTKGFDGIFGMIEGWLTQGVPPSEELRKGLESAKARLDALLARLK